jgi:hypothetical protein
MQNSKLHAETTADPVMTFFEEGDWLRIESSIGDRYLPKAIARKILREIGKHSVKEKSELILCP